MARLRRACSLSAFALMLSLATATSAAYAAAPSPAPLIVIDPGHGGRYSNANANHLREKNVNLAVARELRRELIARGYRVSMTRYTDRTVRFSDTRTWNYHRASAMWSYAFDGRRGRVGGIPRDDLQARVDHANRAGADLFISIHANGSVNRSARGTETWASPRDRLGRQLAPIVNREVVRATGLRNRGTHTADFYVCRWSNMPAILVETAFITNRRDAARLKRPWFRRRIARGIANGVDKWMATAPYRRTYPRLSASSPTDLAVAVSRKDYAAGADVVVIAQSKRAAHVPGAPLLAAHLGAPLLWSEADGPTTSTALELSRLAPRRLVLAGVDGSFDETCVAALAQASGVASSAVEVVGGRDSARLATSIAQTVGVGPTGEIIVAADDDPNARLVAASVSASRHIPLLLVSGSTMQTATAEWIDANRQRIRRSIVVGRASRAGNPAAWELPGSRLVVDGPDPAYNAWRLNARYFTNRSRGATRPVIASLSSEAGYLVAARHAARVNQPLAPVRDNRLYAFTRMWITNRRVPIGGFELLTVGTSSNLMDRMLAKSDAL